jgi:DNA-binding Lrp family transcriptional regulator
MHNTRIQDPLQRELLEDWQRGFPLVARPYAEIGVRLGVAEATIIAALKALLSVGAISRVGGVVRPNTLGASTLAAVAAPELTTNDVAAVLTAEPGVNHVYLRENALNLWFVVTGPDRAYVDAVLKRLEARTGLRVLEMRLEKAYHIDLGFALSGRCPPSHGLPREASAEGFVPRPGDQELVQTLTEGLPLTPSPFADIAERLGRDEADILARLTELVRDGVLPRIGVIVRHRALGWRSNAMVVWDVPPADSDAIGALLASAPGINLCYRRIRHERDWPFNLYCMIHARSRDEALSLLDGASVVAGLDGVQRRILFSLNCFKQTGALVARPQEVAA